MNSGATGKPPHPSPPPLPLTIITGYLGAGKTTLVNHLLGHADGRSMMVLVNDFGEIAIDADLIVAQDADTLILANGCVCCSIGGDLFRAFGMALDRTPRPDHLVIEASGVADAARLADIARAEPDMRLDCVVAVADAETVQERCEDGYVGDTVSRQLQAADLIVVNKVDHAEPEDVRAVADWLDRFAPATPTVYTSRCLIDADIVLGPGMSPNEKRVENRNFHIIETGHDHHVNHEDAYVRWLSPPDLTLTRDNLEKALLGLPDGLLRLKGFVQLSDEDRAVLVQVVGKRQEVMAMPRRPQTWYLTAIGIKPVLDTKLLDFLFRER